MKGGVIINRVWAAAVVALPLNGNVSNIEIVHQHAVGLLDDIVIVVTVGLYQMYGQCVFGSA